MKTTGCLLCMDTIFYIINAAERRASAALEPNEPASHSVRLGAGRALILLGGGRAASTRVVGRWSEMKASLAVAACALPPSPPPYANEVLQSCSPRCDFLPVTNGTTVRAARLTFRCAPWTYCFLFRIHKHKKLLYLLFSAEREVW